MTTTSADPRTLAARLRDARETRGWTQQQVAERLGMARTTIVALEKGERRVKPQELVDLAALLGLSVSDLLQRGAPTEGFVTQLRSALPASAPLNAELIPDLEEFQSRCEDYVRLEKLCQAPLRRGYPSEYEIQGVDAELAAENVAASERTRLALGDGPLVNLRETLETDLGLRIFQLELPSSVVSLYAFAAPLGGCIAVNLRHPAERRRSSLVHEYGRFLTARYRPAITFEERYERRPAGERFAEAFARAFLIPASGLRRHYLELVRERPRGMTHGDLGRLSCFYLVSVEAMTLRLEELRLIPSGTWERLARDRFGGGRTSSLPRANGAHADDQPFSTRYLALAVEAWQRGDLSEGQLARILRTDRLGARETVERLAPAAEDTEAFELGAPLVSSSSR